MKKIILFDLDHTLWDFDFSEKIALEKLFKDEKINEDEIKKYIEKYIEINKKLWLDFEKGLISKKDLANSRFYLLFKFFGYEIDGKEFSRKYTEILKKQGHIFKGANELLEKLSKDFILCAATNGITEIQKGRLENSTISKYFQKVYISDEIGYNKPDKRFFDYVINDLQIDKKEVLMIGDNLIADIKGSFDSNIDNIWYNINGKENILGIELKIAKDYDELINLIYSFN